MPKPSRARTINAAALIVAQELQPITWERAHAMTARTAIEAEWDGVRYDVAALAEVTIELHAY